MKIVVTDDKLYRKVTAYDYQPSAAELHFWYSGTHAGWSRNNPYYQTRGMTVTEKVLVEVQKPGKERA